MAPKHTYSEYIHRERYQQQLLCVKTKWRNRAQQTTSVFYSISSPLTKRVSEKNNKFIKKRQYYCLPALTSRVLRVESACTGENVNRKKYVKEMIL
jgi:hypothetical protein